MDYSPASAEEPPNPSIYTAPGPNPWYRRGDAVPPAASQLGREADPGDTAGKTIERTAEPPPGPFDGIGKIGEKLTESLEKGAMVVVVVLALVLAIEVAK